MLSCCSPALDHSCSCAADVGVPPRRSHQHLFRCHGTDGPAFVDGRVLQRQLLSGRERGWNSVGSAAPGNHAFAHCCRELLNHQKLAGHPHIIEIQEVFLTRCKCSTSDSRAHIFLVVHGGACCQTGQQQPCWQMPHMDYRHGRHIVNPRRPHCMYQSAISFHVGCCPQKPLGVGDGVC